jgi:uncharacterized protein
MIPYRNGQLLIIPIDDMFYSVVNPYIKDGLKVINKIQYNVLMLIDGKKTIKEIADFFVTTEDNIKLACDILSEKNIVNYSNIFDDIYWDTTPKSLNLWIHTTNNCTLRCSYCNIHTLGFNNYLEDEKINILSEKIIQTVKEKNLNYVSLRLAGGEPFLKFKQWKEAIKNLKQRLIQLNCKLRITFLTNLTILSDEIISFIKEEKIGIGVSLDGLDSFQDSTRYFKNGDGSFKIVESNINKLIQSGVRPGIMTVVSNKNIDGLLDFTKYLIRKKIPFRFSFVQNESLDIKKVSSVLKECYKELSSAIDNGYEFSKNHKLCDLKFSDPFFQTCSNGFSGGALYTDGNIYFCHTQFGVTDSIGSIFDKEDLLSIIQKKSYYGEVNDDCKNCNLKYICTSGCPLERVNGKDPHCVLYRELVPIVYKLMGKEKLLEIKKNI